MIYSNGDRSIINCDGYGKYKMISTLILKLLSNELPPGMSIKDIRRCLSSMNLISVSICESASKRDTYYYYVDHFISPAETLRVIEYVEMMYSIYNPGETLKIIDMSTRPLKERISICIIS